MRLAKYLAHAGVASRRASEAIVGEGRVTVDGEVVTDPAREVGEHSVVTLDGLPLPGFEPRVVYMVNKPLGVLSTAHDPYDRPTVVGLLPRETRRLYPVGRLDADSTGLILLTNDGALAHRLTHPSFQVPKMYRATVSGGSVGEQALRRLREGVELEDGPTAPARVRLVRKRTQVGRGRHTAPAGVDEALEITIQEGRNRQVRRMCEAVGHPVRALQRIAFGPLRLGDLPTGAYRRLSDAELDVLRELSGSVPPPRPARSADGARARRTRSKRML